MHNDEELHLTCSCHSEELHIERDTEQNVEPMWCLSLWIRGYSGATTWGYRWKMIWHILKTGRPYGDEVVLEREQMKELSTYVTNQLTLTEKK